MADIFVSYPRQHAAAVDVIVDQLRKLGFSVWTDQQVPAGAEFTEEIERAIDSAKVVVLCWSQAADASRWVKAEAQRAFEAGKLACAVVDGPKPHALPFPLSSLDFADLRQWVRAPSLVCVEWLSILRRVGGLTGRQDIVDWASIPSHAVLSSLGAWRAKWESVSPLAQLVEKNTTADPIELGTETIVSAEPDVFRYLLSADFELKVRSNANCGLAATFSFGSQPIGTVGELVLKRASFAMSPRRSEVINESRYGFSREQTDPVNGLRIRSLGPRHAPIWEITQNEGRCLFGNLGLREPPLVEIRSKGERVSVHFRAVAFKRHLELVDFESGADAPLETGLPHLASPSALASRVVAIFLAKHMPEQGDEVVLGEWELSADMQPRSAFRPVISGTAA